MRKILSAALALVCIWFATPSFANCNLLNPDTITSATVTIPVEYGKTYVWSYDKTNYDFRWDSRAVYGVDSNNELVDGGVALSPNGSASYNATSYFVIQIINPSVVAVQTIFRAASIQPTIESIKNSKMMFEEGTTATAYTPYNPQCATCDGTIVNYVSATGTGVQNGTPTPDNPIYPTFYKQGDMILRKVGDYADSYDATTGKITRRVGVKVLDGTESWTIPGSATEQRSISKAYLGMVPSGTSSAFVTHYPYGSGSVDDTFYVGGSYVNFIVGRQYTMEQWKQYLAQQYANGTPVTIYYPLAEETTEDWPASYCETPIKIATTKYNETKFSPLNTALANAISVVDTVVSNTITQAASIATLQAQKQTRPADDPSDANNAENCPAGKKCLLVEDASGIPHWYEIVTGRLPDGYTELEYIESTGTQWIDTGITPSEVDNIYIRFKNTTTNAGYLIGATNSTGRYNYVGIHNAFQGYGENWGGGSDYKAFNIPADTTTVHTIEIDLRNTPQFYFDSVLKATQSPYETINSTNNLIINANVLGTQNRCSAQYYEVKLSNNGTLIRNLVPALNPDGKIGMYDLVGGRFYENAGTGTFIGGQPVFN